MADLAAITDELWVKYWNMLRLHLARRFPWLARQGVDLDEIASQVVVDIKLGKRRWPPLDKNGQVRTNVEFFPFMCGVARSIASHRLDKEKRMVSIEGQDDDDPDRPKARGSAIRLSTAGGVADQASPLDPEQAASFDQLTQTMLDLVGTDEVLRSILALWRSDPDLKPRDIAEKLGLTSREMQAAQKRLRRKLSSLRRKSAA